MEVEPEEVVPSSSGAVVEEKEEVDGMTEEAPAIIEEGEEGEEKTAIQDETEETKGEEVDAESPVPDEPVVKPQMVKDAEDAVQVDPWDAASWIEVLSWAKSCPIAEVSILKRPVGQHSQHSLVELLSSLPRLSFFNFRRGSTMRAL